jgi:high-affinity Fe2+/Pb2+ permease
MTFRKHACRLGVVLALVLYGPAAWACPVCFSAKNEANRTAFVVTTALLTFLPLGLIGGGVWWLRRRARESAEASSPRRLPRQQRAPAIEPSRPILSGFEDIPPAG